jgi:hypothetical protein
MKSFRKYKMLSLLLGSILIVTSISSVFNIHYCGGNLSSISFNINLKSTVSSNSCCSSAKQEAVRVNDELQFSGKPCCQNKVVQSLDAPVNPKVVIQTIDLNQSYLATPTTFKEVIVKSSSAISSSFFALNEHPPLPKKPRCVKHQVFLI